MSWLARLGAIAALVAALTGRGPDIGKLQRGEHARVARVLSGDALLLDNGLHVFLAEVEAPHGDQAYAQQAREELESLALNRAVVLAYGGTRRWSPRPRRDAAAATTTASAAQPAETAIAHVFVESEGGRWFWLQSKLVAEGAAFARPRNDNNARAADLLAAEAQARAARKGLWALRDYRVLNAAAAAALAVAANQNCLRRDAPYRIVEARVAQADVFGRRASLLLDAPAETNGFALVVFGDAFAHWRGPPLAALAGKRIRAHGGLGMFRDHPQLCLDDSSQLEVLR